MKQKFNSNWPDINIRRSLLAQLVSNRKHQIAAKFICSFAILIFDSVVARVVAELSIIEFAVAVKNDFSGNLVAEKIIEDLGFGIAA
jgi:hypothetical protein